MIKKILIVLTAIVLLLGFSLKSSGISRGELTHHLRSPMEKTMEKALELKANPSLITKDLGVIIVYAFTSPVSLILWGTAGAIDALSSQPSFTYLESDAAAKAGPPKKIVTWNVCMLFGGMPIPFGGVAPVSERISDVSKKIITTNADVICLQEVSPPAAKMLYEELKKEYKYFYTKINPDSWLTLDSGLFVASKVAITDPKVVPLPSSGIIKRALFSFKAGALDFLTTHLEAGDENRDKEMRQKQIETILEVTKTIAKKTLFLGDFNIERGLDFDKSGLKEFFRDLYKGASTATDYFSSKVREIAPKNYSIDYILASKDLRVKISTVDGYEIPVSADSDHHLLLAELKS